MKQDEPHLAADLEKLFNGLFTREQKTRLLGGCDEPLYRPAAGADQICMIYYTRDYFASALHEVHASL